MRQEKTGTRGRQRVTLVELEGGSGKCRADATHGPQLEAEETKNTQDPPGSQPAVV